MEQKRTQTSVKLSYMNSPLPSSKFNPRNDSLASNFQRISNELMWLRPLIPLRNVIETDLKTVDMLLEEKIKTLVATAWFP